MACGRVLYLSLAKQATGAATEDRRGCVWVQSRLGPGWLSLLCGSLGSLGTHNHGPHRASHGSWLERCAASSPAGHGSLRTSGKRSHVDLVAATVRWVRVTAAALLGSHIERWCEEEFVCWAGKGPAEILGRRSTWLLRSHSSLPAPRPGDEALKSGFDTYGPSEFARIPHGACQERFAPPLHMHVSQPASRGCAGYATTSAIDLYLMSSPSTAFIDL